MAGFPLLSDHNSTDRLVGSRAFTPNQMKFQRWQRTDPLTGRLCSALGQPPLQFVRIRHPSQDNTLPLNLWFRRVVVILPIYFSISVLTDQ